MIPKTPPLPIATDALFTGGAEVGLAPRLSVSTAVAKQGVYPASLAARQFNGMVGPLSDHVVQLAAIGVRNWQKLTPTGAALPANVSAYYGIIAAPVAVSSTLQNLYVFGAASTSSAMLYRTRQGDVWRPYSSSPTTSVSISAVAANSAGLMAVGGLTGNVAWFSTDGAQTFTALNCHSAHVYIDVCEMGGVFYGINNFDGTVGRSSGATSFSATTTGTGASSLNLIRSDGSSKILCKGTAAHTYVSADGGATWLASALPVFALFGGTEVTDIRYSPGLGVWMAVSTFFEVATSTDGLNWTQTQAPVLGSATNVALASDGNGAWVAAYAPPGTGDARVAYSVDGGFTWVSQSLGDGSYASYGYPSICYDKQHDCFFALFKNNNTTEAPLIFRSLSTGTAGGALT